LAFADVLMPIDARARCCLGIVQMNRGQPIAPNDAIEFGEHLSYRDCVCHIVTGCENVGGVEANADSFRLSRV